VVQKTAREYERVRPLEHAKPARADRRVLAEALSHARHDGERDRVAGLRLVQHDAGEYGRQRRDPVRAPGARMRHAERVLGAVQGREARGQRGARRESEPGLFDGTQCLVTERVPRAVPRPEAEVPGGAVGAPGAQSPARPADGRDTHAVGRAAAQCADRIVEDEAVRQCQAPPGLVGEIAEILGPVGPRERQNGERHIAAGGARRLQCASRRAFQLAERVGLPLGRRVDVRAARGARAEHRPIAARRDRDRLRVPAVDREQDAVGARRQGAGVGSLAIRSHSSRTRVRICSASAQRSPSSSPSAPVIA
jgi:hypothetical protein